MIGNFLDLPYVCGCGCGYTNGDMFEDYFLSIGKEPTVRDITQFDIARKLFYVVRDQQRAEAKSKPIRKRKSYTKRSDYWNKLGNGKEMR